MCRSWARGAARTRPRTTCSRAAQTLSSRRMPTPQTSILAEQQDRVRRQARRPRRCQLAASARTSSTRSPRLHTMPIRRSQRITARPHPRSSTRTQPSVSSRPSPRTSSSRSQTSIRADTRRTPSPRSTALPRTSRGRQPSRRTCALNCPQMTNRMASSPDSRPTQASQETAAPTAQAPPWPRPRNSTA